MKHYLDAAEKAARAAGKVTSEKFPAAATGQCRRSARYQAGDRRSGTGVN